VSQTGEALKAIESYIVTMNQHMDSIATSAKEQSVGLAEVNTAVNQMDQVTQQNAAMVEEANAAGATLAMESAKLKDLVEQFRLGERAAEFMQSGSSGRGVVIASRAHAPAASPVRAMANKLTRVFSSAGSAVSVSVPANDSWEEF
jgi:methyl-accepting chemotaxis protein